MAEKELPTPEEMQEMAERTMHKIIKKISNEKYTDGIFVVDGRIVVKDSVARIER